GDPGTALRLRVGALHVVAAVAPDVEADVVGRAHLLQSDDLGSGGLHPLPHALPQGGADAVDVDRGDAQHGPYPATRAHSAGRPPRMLPQRPEKWPHTPVTSRFTKNCDPPATHSLLPSTYAGRSVLCEERP